MTSAMQAATPQAATVGVGSRWVVDVDLVDVDGDAPAALVTLPDGTTAAPTVSRVAAGRWRVVYVPAAPGRHVVTVTAAGDAVAVAAYVVGVTTAAGMPTADDVAAYIGPTAASWSTDDLADALAVEASAQRDVCLVPAAYPESLRGALLRRAARNLAMRRLPLAVAGAESDAGPTVLPGTDPEVRRLERPHRRMPVG